MNKPKRNVQGASTVAVSITLPIELNKTINDLATSEHKTRSLVIAELLEKGLAV